jgi:hypothetical protein
VVAVAMIPNQPPQTSTGPADRLMAATAPPQTNR